MKWITRARPKTDRIACPWLTRRALAQLAKIVHAADIAADLPARSLARRPQPARTDLQRVVTKRGELEALATS